ncbi:oxidoreductase, acting on the CH-CH group of donors [Galdieria sulphuraria]|uniref:Oxidoreductase, acting on the CH-CH group of donors n=1 Tax=Galdieria sulphuraria TaxID=130081 RepID=M2X3K0_GALSU|nr:oxidoreductase, acting on the CH-CH group of donors [Galdieria sulphuraria]EME30990.1 oxidoreductase, acting on the CH-CH group of donors [Galdieria sulphuraria]|eukprot:XP_005707510.1 oxidoreductase, acting on the CH-CH group of donors [Galdieria sulphuraria]
MDKLTDFAGASNFAVLALWSYMGYSSFSTRQKWITSLLVLWSARLALYLGYRIWFVFGEDRRLDSFRDNIFKLMGFWTLQGLWAFVVSLPAVLCNMNSQIRPVGRLDYCGYTIFAIGFLCETIADFQKQYFKQRNPERWCDWGLWRYSRHPNYFGELLVWYGIYSLAWNGLTTFHRFIALSSPLLITWLLITVSGIPLLEKSADSKYGSLLEYQLYKKRTSILIPLPPQIVERWNRWIGN